MIRVQYSELLQLVLRTNKILMSSMRKRGNSMRNDDDDKKEHGNKDHDHEDGPPSHPGKPDDCPPQAPSRREVG